MMCEVIRFNVAARGLTYPSPEGGILIYNPDSGVLRTPKSFADADAARVWILSKISKKSRSDIRPIVPYTEARIFPVQQVDVTAYENGYRQTLSTLRQRSTVIIWAIVPTGETAKICEKLRKGHTVTDCVKLIPLRDRPYRTRKKKICDTFLERLPLCLRK